MSEITTSRDPRQRPRGYIENYAPQAKTQVLLDQVKDILAEYAEYLPLTVRQIFYRLVGKYGYAKTERDYANLSEHLNRGRRGGVIPFSAIRDGGTTVLRPGHFTTPDDFWRVVRSAASRYTRDKLARQPYDIEVWCEAAGMAPQLAAVTFDYSIPVYSGSGFNSTTERHDMSDRVCDGDRSLIVLQLGDFDPSGVAIYENAAEDVRAFVLVDRRDDTVDVEHRRVALTAEQVHRYVLPTAPPKASDSRSRNWVGETCQLEALAPDDLATILREAIEGVFDLNQLQHDREEEQRERREILAALRAAGGAS